MKRTINFFSLIFLLLVLKQPFAAFSQTQPDAGMWNTASVEYEFSKKFSFAVDEELRLKDNFSRLNLLYTNLGISYKPLKGVKVSLIYRFIEKYTDYNRFSIRNRLMLDITYRYKISKTYISYRSRLQGELSDYYTSSEGKIAESFWRNKFEIGYKFNKYTPYIGTELRYQFSDPRNREADFGWHRIRTFAGIDYNLNKNNTVGLYCLIQNEFAAPDPQSLYIVGLQYSLTLKARKLRH